MSRILKSSGRLSAFFSSIGPESPTSVRRVFEVLSCNHFKNGSGIGLIELSLINLRPA